MKIKYFYQQLFSHIGVLIVAFLVLSLLFTNYVEKIIFQSKTDELLEYGQNILFDLERSGQNPIAVENVINQYARVLFSRDIQFSVFEVNGTEVDMLNPYVWRGPAILLDQKDWDMLRSGTPVVIRSDLKRYKQNVSIVTVPYIAGGSFVGGVLLVSPVKGPRELISGINEYLLYTVLIALGVSFLLSWLLSRMHVIRIKRIQKAASAVAAGDYSVHIPSSNFDEIGELSNDFNRMVDKISRSMEEIDSLENRRRQFMADVSHEMRTPLTTISGIIEGLRNNMIPEAEKEKGINLVSKETKRLIRLVNENLDYEKIRSNQVTLNKEEIQLLEAFEIIKEQLDMQAEEGGNTIEINVKDDIMIVADYDRLLQILINITKNSIQFTNNGKITLSGRENDGLTIIEIEDTGIGIDAEEIEKIWRRFYKADTSRRNNPYGAFGLGLSIVKRLVQLHDGDIRVESEKGRGTKFTIKIPSPKNQT
ncbi:two-component sensor histidine kinase [Bacillus sp. FJAT-27225]|uniref:sensor histidine kinase n=1 Tax=Bacillus sp. FJAT-27225 TaxID=1743144 RepID=UPI00080C28F2|nr:HAMP domain-containing sensor histidine kinase [Bacillus sp. FJAT-27225]OCA87539.1 two-component sensor histidine kinase [Bacillus sp. FJAT-27225]